MKRPAREDGLLAKIRARCLDPDADDGTLELTVEDIATVYWTLDGQCWQDVSTVRIYHDGTFGLVLE